ncbi:RNA helicase, partial [Streptomyces sp. SID7499]|nr:RNA helicase [Streptomyces sp. SID7499]
AAVAEVAAEAEAALVAAVSVPEQPAARDEQRRDERGNYERRDNRGGYRGNDRRDDRPSGGFRSGGDRRDDRGGRSF